MGSAAAPSWLARFVEDVRVTVPVAGRALQVERLPDGRTTLFLRVLEGGRQGDLTVAGPRTRALYKQATGVAQVITLQFKPGWSAPLFGVAASALTDRLVPLEDIWGRSGGTLCERLLAARSVPEVLDRLSRAIALRAHQTFEPAVGAARPARGSLARRRRGARGAAWPSGSASRRDIFAAPSPRASASGRRISRGPFACSVPCGWRRPRSDWVRIAADAGYYDQAHLIADFRELVGLTPGAFVKRAGDLRLSADLCAAAAAAGSIGSRALIVESS